MNYRDVVLDLTLKYAGQVIGDCGGLKVKFSRSMKYPNGKCYPFRKVIIYNDRYLALNKDNMEALRYTIIEEWVLKI